VNFLITYSRCTIGTSKSSGLKTLFRPPHTLLIPMVGWRSKQLYANPNLKSMFYLSLYFQCGSNPSWLVSGIVLPSLPQNHYDWIITCLWMHNTSSNPNALKSLVDSFFAKRLCRVNREMYCQTKFHSIHQGGSYAEFLFPSKV